MRKLIPLFFVIIAAISCGGVAYAKTKTVTAVVEPAPVAPIVITAPEPQSIPPSAPTVAPPSAPAMGPSPQINTDYFPVLPMGATPDVSPSYVPVVANYPLAADHSAIAKVVLYIHDASRDARRAVTTLRTLAGPSEAATMIVAPQFLIEEDMAAITASSPQMERRFSRWAYGTWETGSDSAVVAPAHGISSFTVLDLLLMYVGEKSLFPNVQEIVIVGMGAGGNFVQRYAAVGRSIDILTKQKTSVRFVVADASSYLYLTSSRFRGGRNGFAPSEDKACPNYNAWPYGLDQLNNYSKRVGANAAKIGYNTRRMAYMLGATANIGIGEMNCAALIQGADEKTRMDIYQLYLKGIYGEDILQRQSFTIIPKAGYDAAALFGSTCGMSLVFGDGLCVEPSMTGSSTSLRNR